MSYRGRFAPSPTGALHLGSLATALAAWWRARQQGGALLLRVEDIDTPRVVAGSAAQQLDDLAWLGLDWDEPPLRQSTRGAAYEAAIATLAAHGAVYLCDCSRREIAGVASAPHAGEEGPRYPGTCRRFGMRDRAWKRPPAVRVALPDREIVVRDLWQGERRQHVAAEVGDFVLKRGDGIYAYQLAVVVDDRDMRVSEVVRGADLLDSAPRQVLLAEMLGARAPAFAHAPLVLDADGARLQKRTPGHTLAAARAAGVAPAVMVGRLAAALGLLTGADARCSATPAALIDRVDLAALRGRRELRLGRDAC
ncbi:MAG: tRNA glutamyl-Q(34) synthetase GluQRS [Deltaproteobacteria bacterium]|nr:tRNA glutamyl-Q(34) synthetase GluQRS [Deltaproteobacteria bacterium]